MKFNFFLAFLLLFTCCLNAFESSVCEDAYVDLEYNSKGYRGDFFAGKCKLGGDYIYGYESFILSSLFSPVYLESLYVDTLLFKTRGDSYKLVNETLQRKYEISESVGFKYDLLVSSIYEQASDSFIEKSKGYLYEGCLLVESLSDGVEYSFNYYMVDFIIESKPKFIPRDKNLEFKGLVNHYRITNFKSKKTINREVLGAVCNQDESGWKEHLSKFVVNK